MSTGSGSYGEPPEATGNAASDAWDDGTFADVLNGFTLASGRARRKRKKSKESPPPPAAGAHAAAEPTAPPPSADQGDRVTSLVSPPGSTDGDSPRPGGLFDPGPPSGE